MIKKAHFINDREKAACLWRECFGDSEEYIEFFLNNIPDENELYIYESDSEAAGMMILMPEEIAWNGKKGKVYYLYALCVKESCRGRGIAGEMLDFAKETAKNANAEICLVPGSEKLRKYYAKRGFIDVFARTVQTVHVNSTDGACTAQSSDNVFKSYDSHKIYKDDIKEILKNTDLIKSRHDELYTDKAVYFGKTNFGFALKEHSAFGGFVYYADGDYIIGEENSGILSIRETTYDDIMRICKKSGFSKIQFQNIRNPFLEYPVKTVPYAMMTHHAFTEEFIKETMLWERYINFCFD